MEYVKSIFRVRFAVPSPNTLNITPIIFSQFAYENISCVVGSYKGGHAPTNLMRPPYAFPCMH